MKLIKNKKTPARDFGEGLTLQIFLDKAEGAKNLDVGTVSIAPKNETGMHTRDFEEVIVILSGKGQVISGNGKIFTLNKNDCLLIPAGTTHKHVNHTNRPLRQLYIFAPQAHENIQKQLRELKISKKETPC